jgi:hypothetical protein
MIGCCFALYEYLAQNISAVLEELVRFAPTKLKKKITDRRKAQEISSGESNGTAGVV